MLKFSANLSMLFAEHDFLDRFKAAADAGFTAVEYVGPYAYAPDQIAELLQRYKLSQVLFNLPAGDWLQGDRGLACQPDRRQEFQDSVATAISWAKALNCPTLNCLAGLAPEGISRDKLWQTYAENVGFAGKALAKAGIQLVIEAINPFDIPGYFINTSAQSMQAIAECGSGNVKFQYDVYHMQRVEGELTNTLTRLMPAIGHIQIADAPLRHEPGTGEINYDHILKHIDALGYQGWIGCEYKPKTKTVAGLDWIKRFQ